MNSNPNNINPIEGYFEEYRELKEILERSNEVSSITFIDDIFSRSILLAAASYFENEIVLILEDFTERTVQDKRLKSFIQKKAISRQYHTYFSWKEKNANSFFAMFGSDFTKEMKSIVKNNPSLKDDMEAFIDIGLQRNTLAHGGYFTHDQPKTIPEIESHIQKALNFISFMKVKFSEESSEK